MDIVEQRRIWTRLARELTNAQLAARIGDIQNNRRVFPKELADSYLEEATRRLNWKDVYEAHEEEL